MLRAKISSCSLKIIVRESLCHRVQFQCVSHLANETQKVAEAFNCLIADSSD